MTCVHLSFFRCNIFQSSSGEWRTDKCCINSSLKVRLAFRLYFHYILPCQHHTQNILLCLETLWNTGVVRQKVLPMVFSNSELRNRPLDTNKGQNLTSLADFSSFSDCSFNMLVLFVWGVGNFVKKHTGSPTITPTDSQLIQIKK